MTQRNPRSIRRRALLLLAYTLVFGGFLFRNVILDEAPDPDDDLALPALEAEPPEDQNSLALLLKAHSEIVAHQDFTLYDFSPTTIRQGHATAGKPTPDDVEWLLTRNRSVLDRIHEAVERPQLFIGDQGEALEEIEPAMRDLRMLVYIFISRAEANGDWSEALRLSCRLLELGARYDEATRQGRPWMTAQSYRRTAYQVFYRLTADDRLEPNQLRQLRARSTDTAPSAEAVRRRLRSEYATFRFEIRQGSAPDTFGIKRPWFIPTRLIYKPKRTLNQTGAVFRHLLTLVDRSPDAVRTEISKRSEDAPSTWESLRQGNILGNKVAEFGHTVGGSLLQQFAMVRTELRAVQILASLREFEGDHGQLPETLEELVPTYLPSVPIDPMDGKPFRYSKERAVVWSVGAGLENRNGSTSPDAGQRGYWDIVYPTFPLRTETSK